MTDQKEDVNLDFDKSKVCFMSTFPPRECGIATFTQDLVSSLNKRFNPKLKSKVIALNENMGMYNYDGRVLMHVNKDDIEDFIEIAKKINKSDNIKIVCIQHEFGLFGGDYGNYLVPFLETIEKPIVVAFHSVLPNPDEMRKRVVRFICSKSAAIIVMAKKAVEILSEDYEIEKEKINVVHHGIPNVRLSGQDKFKKKLKLEGKTVLSTFGLLSRGKGIEYVIKALPKLIEKYPNLLYLIVGETHPVVREREGEEYRKELMELTKKLGVQENVKFYNKYLSLKEIIDCIMASDIYLCTNLEKEQIVSGTLSYAIGCGRAIVSTPITYAEEVLDEGRGVLTKFRDSDSYVKAIDEILSDPDLKESLEKNAYNFGRQMIWNNVAANYLRIFNDIVKLREETVEKYPKIKLNHLKRLTDSFGCLQFSNFAVPDSKSGYTVDDNSRALIVAVMHHELTKSNSSLNLAKTYLNFLKTTQEDNGYFKDVSQRDSFLKKKSEDSFGRAIWALGVTVGISKRPEIVDSAKEIFQKSYAKIDKLRHLRAKAFAINGLYHYYKKYGDKEIIYKIKKLAGSLMNSFKKRSSEDWSWFEDSLTYSNSKIPEAFFQAYELTKDEKYLEIAEKSLNFLSDLLFIDGKLSPIGQNGWYQKDGKRAFFDQQPLDASSMVQTCLVAFSLTNKEEYYKKAVLSLNWFLGKNHLGQMVYDEITGGCHDGLGKSSINLNQGAESTISYLLARIQIENFKKEDF